MTNPIKRMLLLLGLISVVSGCVSQKITEELILGVGSTYTSNHVELTPTQVTIYGRSTPIPAGTKTVRIDRRIENGSGTVSLQFDGQTPTIFRIKSDTIVQ